MGTTVVASKFAYFFQWAVLFAATKIEAG